MFSRFYTGMTCLAIALGIVGTASTPLAHEIPARDPIALDRVSIPCADGRTLQAAFWSPIDAAAAPRFLIVFSHGTLGSWAENADTAAALAKAGFVVAAITHDEVTHEHDAPYFMLDTTDRTRQFEQLIDYGLHDWRGHAALSQTTVGAFGVSLGGFTVLEAAGGRPDPATIAPHCRVAPAEWSCHFVALHRIDVAEPAWWHGPASPDPRIKAAIIAAPALGYVFGKAGLASVTIPIQLWRAANDHILAEPFAAEAVRADLPSPPEYHVVPRADHSDFTAPCWQNGAPPTNPACISANGFDRTAFHTEFNAAIIDFFRRTLRR